MNHFAPLSAIVACVATVGSAFAAEQPWVQLDIMPAAVQAGGPWIRPTVFKAFHLDTDAMHRVLAAVPKEQLPINPGNGMELEIPHPSGGFTRFHVFETPVMHPDLGARYPEIKTYIGQGIDDPAAMARFDLTPAGFHGMVLTPDGDYYIDPYTKGDSAHYGVYFKSDYVGSAPHHFNCQTTGELPQHAGGYGSRESGRTLRTYRLALSATGEYTQFHGGTVAAGLAALVTATNRITGIYERDLSIRMQLVPNNDLIVYTNPGTDPFTAPTNPNALSANMSENHTSLATVIGWANFDIGHVVTTIPDGGVATLAGVCVNSRKARAVTGQANPVGDPFVIDYVAHEMGHQFGAQHTYNGILGACGTRVASSAFEPGSGVTIMAYAGICGTDDLQPHSDAMFHHQSYLEILSYVNDGLGNTCSNNTATGNTLPIFSAGMSYVVPRGTAFTVAAPAAVDNDGDAVTYSWEEHDLGPTQPLVGDASVDNGTSPIFRPFLPVSSPARTFPRYASVLSGTLVGGEQYPVLDRNMNLRCVVRDNRIGGGGVVEGDANVQVVGTAGPFNLTFPNTNVNISGTQTITWNVANTDIPPLNCEYVRILLSTDGGNTFPVVLNDRTRNVGSAVVTLPSTRSTTARIRIEPTNGIYFDISDVNFSMNVFTPPNAPTNVRSSPNPVCRGRTVTLTGTVPAGHVIDYYAGFQNCGDTFVGTGTGSTNAITIVVAPGTPTLYWAKARNTTTNNTSTTCTPVIVVVITPVADFDQSGGVDGQDVEAFYLAWGAGDPSADTNEDGSIDGADVQAFFLAWEAGGCP